jgi:hypothetical protein
MEAALLGASFGVFVSILEPSSGPVTYFWDGTLPTMSSRCPIGAMRRVGSSEPSVDFFVPTTTAGCFTLRSSLLNGVPSGRAFSYEAKGNNLTLPTSGCPRPKSRPPELELCSLWPPVLSGEGVSFSAFSLPLPLSLLGGGGGVEGGSFTGRARTKGLKKRAMTMATEKRMVRKDLLL